MDETDSSAITDDEGEEYDGEEDDSQESSFTDYNATASDNRTTDK